MMSIRMFFNLFAIVAPSILADNADHYLVSCFAYGVICSEIEEGSDVWWGLIEVKQWADVMLVG